MRAFVSRFLGIAVATHLALRLSAIEARRSNFGQRVTAAYAKLLKPDLRLFPEEQA